MNHRVGAIVLAGGASARMGCDKASLHVNGMPLLAGVIGSITTAGCGPVVIVGRAAAAMRVVANAPMPQSRRGSGGHVYIDDHPLGQGPAAAVAHGARALVGDGHIINGAPIEHVVVMPCDLPWITSDAIAELVEFHVVYGRDEDPNRDRATVVRLQERPQWTCAVMNRALAIRAASTSASVPMRLRELYRHADVAWFQDDTDTFRDADTPEALQHHHDTSPLVDSVAEVSQG